MIKAKKREYKIAGFILVTVLLLLCAFNISYAYFTATASVNGTINFSELNVKFGYLMTSGSTSVTDMSGNTLTVTPNTALINRGDTFGLRINSVDVSGLYFTASRQSCNFYVRFKLDAYKQNSTDATNYGRYFQINNSSNSNLFSREIVTNSNETNAVYYVKNALTPKGNRLVSKFCDSITLLDSAPVELLDGEVKLTITFLAGQSQNGAYDSVFNDGWGYYSSWK